MSATFDGYGTLTQADKMEIDRARVAARIRFADVADTLSSESRDDVDPDNPPITEEQFAGFRSAAEVVPGLVAAKLRRKDQRPEPFPSDTFSVHLDTDVVEALRASGEGWQERINDLLRNALAIGPGAASRSVVDDIAWLENMGDVVRRAFAGEPVAQDEIRWMAEAVQRRIKPASSGVRRA